VRIGRSSVGSGVNALRVVAIALLTCTALSGCERGDPDLERGGMAPWEGLKTIHGSNLYVKAVGD